MVALTLSLVCLRPCMGGVHSQDIILRSGPCFFPSLCSFACFCVLCFGHERVECCACLLACCYLYEYVRLCAQTIVCFLSMCVRARMLFLDSCCAVFSTGGCDSSYCGGNIWFWPPVNRLCKRRTNPSWRSFPWIQRVWWCLQRVAWEMKEAEACHLLRWIPPSSSTLLA